MIAVLVLIALLIASLTVVDLLSMRAPERFGAEAVLHGDGPFRSGDTNVWVRKETPVSLKLSAALATLFGLLAFPGTLAPVIITVLSLQAHPIGGDGATALAAVIVAALSMSAALKTIRSGRMMLELSEAAIAVMWRCLIWLAVWNAAVLGSLLLMRQPVGMVATIVWVYVASTIAIFAMQGLTARIAAAHVDNTKSEEDVESEESEKKDADADADAEPG